MISLATQLYPSTLTSHPKQLRASSYTYMTSPNVVVERTTPDSVPTGLSEQLEAKKREKNEKMRQIMALVREIQGLQYTDAVQAARESEPDFLDLIPGGNIIKGLVGVDANGMPGSPQLREKMKELEIRKAELGKLTKEINELMNQIDRIRNAAKEEFAPQMDSRVLRYQRPATAVTVVQDAIVSRQTPTPATTDFDTRKLSPAMNPLRG